MKQHLDFGSRDYQVEPWRIADSDLLTESIEIHREMFGRLPRMVAADAGFYSQNNERTATETGVAYVAIANRRSRSDEEKASEDSPVPPSVSLENRLRRKDQHRWDAPLGRTRRDANNLGPSPVQVKR